MLDYRALLFPLSLKLSDLEVAKHLVIEVVVLHERGQFRLDSELHRLRVLISKREIEKAERPLGIALVKTWYLVYDSLHGLIQ